MPDITMCEDRDCPKRKECYRFNAKPSEFRQSWFTESPRKKDSLECRMFWEIIPMTREEQEIEKECHEAAIFMAGKDPSYSHYLFCKVLAYECINGKELKPLVINKINEKMEK